MTLGKIPKKLTDLPRLWYLLFLVRFFRESIFYFELTGRHFYPILRQVSPGLHWVLGWGAGDWVPHQPGASHLIWSELSLNSTKAPTIHQSLGPQPSAGLCISSTNIYCWEFCHKNIKAFFLLLLKSLWGWGVRTEFQSLALVFSFSNQNIGNCWTFQGDSCRGFALDYTIVTKVVFSNSIQYWHKLSIERGWLKFKWCWWVWVSIIPWYDDDYDCDDCDLNDEINNLEQR